MSHLSDAQLHQLRKKLDEREAELQSQVRGAREAAADQVSGQAGVVGDQGDNATDRLQHGIRHVEMSRDIEELVEIEAARRRMDDGSYGQCVDCHQPIEARRLLAHPTALRCALCQGRYEQMHPSRLRDPG
ncbi:TraR/DksA family transcriptional regulator [Caldimonas thermodepolymerans]|jgi:DnaK suppressor protein|uniref:TraR/DksA family transcriptional regulator n=1 Tax=Caldimonas thermodepolymerans TaxID=215580 RepID=A0AA46DIB5_9BURK|nr:TraR/DksA family transcriptional regulator [Caldimonas thermodepolymerans]TCP09956.1 TraR/DksA family transcriptional regulator [Caldimonas thermodepolymerans]UZG46340.1 TraR/DksA family transcriptional regulator [Caldimonas thermodepolymerans]